MGLSLAFSPHRQIVLDELAETEVSFPVSLESEVRQVGHEGNASLLLWLAKQKSAEALPMPAIWWRDFAGQYLTLFCKRGGVFPVELSEPFLTSCLINLPVMPGTENLNAESLHALWKELEDQVGSKVASYEGNAQAWLQAEMSHWHLVGRVTLHLAENPRNLERPFAFLATYTTGLNADGKPRHQPLRQAVIEQSGHQQSATLLHLLAPLSRAADESPWVKEMLDTKAVYEPQAWSPGQALQFLREVPKLEHSGLSVRIPDWWKSGAPPRPKVTLQVDEASPHHQQGGRSSSLLDFSIEVSLEGEKLTPEELAAIKTAQGLMMLKGRWVEVDGAKLQAVLGHWHQARLMQFQGGMTFLQAMRLLSGAGLSSGPSVEGDTALLKEEVRSWTSVQAGAVLEAKLAAMRDPSRLTSSDPDPSLQVTLRPYQTEGVKWLHFMTRLGLGGCLADDMGLGKTVQILALLSQMKRVGELDSPALLIVPASLLMNWKQEAARFTPHLLVVLAHPSGDDGKVTKTLNSGDLTRLLSYDLVVTTYGMVTRLESFQQTTWSLLILDEAQAIKTAGSIQTRSVKKLRAKTRLALTGTPVENRLGDLWSLFDFLNPGLLGTSKSFAGWVKSLSKAGTYDFAALRRLVRPYILRRVKTDKSIIADLPPKTELHAWCLLTRPQAVLYEQAVQALAKTLAEVDKEARRGFILSALMTFKQICNHPSQQSGDSYYDPSLSGKFMKLKHLAASIAAQQEKVLIFTQFTEIIPALRELLRSVFSRDGLVLTGATRVEERQALVSQFQQPQGPPFFILSLKAGGTGVTLTAASHVVHFDRWWNPAVENQATDRAYRIGQKQRVMVHKMICRGTLEEKIDRLIDGKKSLAQGLMAEGSEMSLTEMSDAELLNFVTLDAATAVELD